MRNFFVFRMLKLDKAGEVLEAESLGVKRMSVKGFKFSAMTNEKTSTR